MMASVVQPTQAAIDPIARMLPAVESRRWAWPLVFLVVGATLSGLAVSSRWDASTPTIRELEAQGELQKLTEQELGEKVTTAQRIRIVSSIAKGIFWVPLSVLLLGLVLELVGWLFGRPAPFSRYFSAAAISTMPIALFHILFAICAFRQFSISDAQIPFILPSHLAALFPKVSPAAFRALSSVDLFGLWTAVLLGLGFSAASGMRKGRSLLVGISLYAIYACVFVIGLPGLRGGPA